MTITVSTSDPRSVKALAILADSGRWLRSTTPDGRTVFTVPSQSEPGVAYTVDCHGCDCPDRLGRLERYGSSEPCKHQLAVMLYCARESGRAVRRAALGARRSAAATLAEYDAVYGSGQGHNTATCRLAVCPDC